MTPREVMGRAQITAAQFGHDMTTPYPNPSRTKTTSSCARCGCMVIVDHRTLHPTGSALFYRCDS